MKSFANTEECFDRTERFSDNIICVLANSCLVFPNIFFIFDQMGELGIKTLDKHWDWPNLFCVIKKRSRTFWWLFGSLLLVICSKFGLTRGVGTPNPIKQQGFGHM